MKFQYNPLSAEPLGVAPADDNITFDLPSHIMYVKGVDFVGTDTTYDVFKKPTSSTNGEVGLVPVPTYTETATRYLREDGTWVTPPNTNYYRPIKVDNTSILGNNNTALNLVAGNNILLTPEQSGSSYTGKVTISNSGVRSISTGTADGTISVDTAGTVSNVKVKGLGSAAYTDSSIYAIKQALTSDNLNNVTTPGFYNAGGSNTCTNTPFTSGTAFGLTVIKTASGEYYEQIIYQYNSNNSYRRYCSSGTWSDWEQENWDALDYNVVTNATDGLVPKFDSVDGTIDSNTTDWVLTNNNGSIGWYKLPANAFVNDKVTNTTNNTTKAYLLGATTRDTTSTAVTDSGVYLGTEAGHLHATVYHGALGSDVTTDTIEQTSDVTDSHVASVGYVNQAIDDLINGAPGTMDTLKEISDYLQGSTSGGVVEGLANKLNRDGTNTMTAGSEITWDSQNSKVARIGQYSTDGSMLISIDGNNTVDGLVLGGTSGNLLWKGSRIADADNTNYTASVTSSTTNSYKIGDLSIAGETFSLYGKDTNTNKVNTGTSGKLAYYSGTDAISSYTGTKGAYNLPIYMNAGVPTAVSSIGEAYLSWGGKNFTASYSPIDATLVDSLGANRFDCLPADCISVQYSRDGGTTWLDYEASDNGKINLVSQTSTNASYVVGKSNSTNGIPDVNSKLRIIVNSMSNNVSRIYTSLNKFVIYCSTSGSQGCTCTIKYRTQQNYESNTDTWTTVAENVSISGWSGYNVINTSGFATYGNTPATHAREIIFEFGITSHTNSNYYGLNIQKIFAYGGVGWTTPSNMAARGHLYKYDAQQKATFPAAVTATKFIKSGGTSAQFLKADGSVDTNTYAKTSDISGLFTDLSSTSNINLSMSIGGTTKSITDLWARRLALSPTTITSTTDDTVANWAALGTSVHAYITTGQLTDQPSQYGLLLNVTKGTDGSHQIWMTQATGSLCHRGGNASGWSGTWRTILDSSNYTNYVNTTNFPGLNKTGTVTSVKVGSTSYTPSSGVVSLPAYPTLSELSGISTVKASGTTPLTLSATKSGTTVTITGNIATGTTSSVGVVKQHKAADCTTFTSDEGATTPAAVKKAIETFVTVTPNLTSGTKVGSISINGTSTDLYCQTNTNTTYSFTSGVDKFTVTPSSGTAVTVNVGTLLVNGTYTSNGGEQRPSYVDNGKVRWNMMRNTTTYYDVSEFSGYADWMMMDTYTGSDVPYVTMIGVLKASTPHAYIASGSKGDSTGKWTIKTLLDSSNYTSYVNSTNFPGINKTGTVTSITPGTGLTGTSSDVAITSTGTINLKSAATNEIGGIKVASVGTSASGANTTVNANKFAVHIDSNNLAYVAIPAYTNNSGDITSVVAGNGLTGGATSGEATLNVGAGTGISVAADTVSIKTATSDELGGIKIGYTQSGKTYPIVLDTNNKAYVNVPWSDTWRKIQINGTDVLGTGTSTNPLNLKAGTNITLSNSNGTVTISATSSSDTKVTQTASTASTAYPLLLAAGITTATTTAYFDSNVTLTPSTNFLLIPDGTVNTSVLQLEYNEYLHTIEGDSDGNLIIAGSEGIIFDNDVICNLSIRLTGGVFAPTTSGGTTYGQGTAGQVLTSTGSNVYWSSLSDYALKTDLSDYVTLSSLNSMYFATTSYVNNAIAGINSGTTVSWGTTSSYTSPLTVAGTTKTVSLSGHTHSYAPIAHASTATTYGAATTSNYGHVKISNGDCNTVASASGLAAGMDHTHGNYATTTALASYLPLSGGTLTGAVTSSSTVTATAFYQDSDRTLKENIELIQDSVLDKIYNTNEVTFTWKNNGNRSYGYIAQDMQSISGDLIKVRDDGHLALDYNSVLVLQVAALKQKINNLEERIQNLERSL